MFIEFKPKRPHLFKHESWLSDAGKRAADRGYSAYCSEFYKALGYHKPEDAAKEAKDIAIYAIAGSMDGALYGEGL